MMTIDQSQLSAERLRLLYRLSQTFNSSLDLDEVLNRVMDEVIAITQAERGFVMLPESDGHPWQWAVLKRRWRLYGMNGRIWLWTSYPTLLDSY
jgi:GAF domain-containing protein